MSWFCPWNNPLLLVQLCFTLPLAAFTALSLSFCSTLAQDRHNPWKTLLSLGKITMTIGGAEHCKFTYETSREERRDPRWKTARVRKGKMQCACTLTAAYDQSKKAVLLSFMFCKQGNYWQKILGLVINTFSQHKSLQHVCICILIEKIIMTYWASGVFLEYFIRQYCLKLCSCGCKKQ